MEHRKLRIAWSVAWGIVAVLLVALWVRSYSWLDMVDIPLNRTQIEIGSYHGYVQASYDGYEAEYRNWDIRSYGPNTFREFRTHFDFGVQRKPLFLYAEGTYCLLSLATIAMTTAPWLRHLRWRFSLRTLLIVTTPVAMGLGLIVWLSR